MVVSKEFEKVLRDLETCLNNDSNGLKQCLARVPRRQRQKVAVFLIQRFLDGRREYCLDDILTGLEIDERGRLCALNKALQLRSQRPQTPQVEPQKEGGDCESDVMSGISWRSDASEFSDISTVLSGISWN